VGNALQSPGIPARGFVLARTVQGEFAGVMFERYRMERKADPPV
jgi:hypothetical protein